jgi:tetratricopeptide (TPR) repeat protein|eukprot:COSAG06_NODE_6578_length_2872_cov_4.563447_3_plen_158_part_00
MLPPRHQGRRPAPPLLQLLALSLPLLALLPQAAEAQQQQGGGGSDPLETAEQLERAGRLEDAAATYRAAIGGAYASEPAAHAGLGGVLSQLGDLQGAVKAFKAALKAGGQPKYGIHFNIGLAYMQGGRLSGAVKHFKLAVKHNPVRKIPNILRLLCC